MTHPRRDCIIKAFMLLSFAGFVWFGIHDDDIMAATFLFGYLGVAAWWVWGRRES